MSRDTREIREATASYATQVEQDVPAGYKRTEVGVIPEDWDISSLRDIATISTGSTPPTNDATNYGGEYFFVSPADIGEHKYITSTEKMLSKKGFEKARHFPRHSILFVSIGSTIGKCAIAPTKLTANQQINAILPSPKISSDYLYYSVCLVAKRIKALAGEQAVPIINKTEFSKTVVPLAPFNEQHAIATALSDVDALITALDRLITKKRAIKTAAMQQLLTGKTRLPGFSGKWETKRLGELGSTYGGIVGKSKDDFGHGKSKYITFLNIISNVVVNTRELGLVDIGSYENQNSVRKGDLFFNGSSETPEEVGLSAVLLDEADEGRLFLNSFCFGFRLKSDASSNPLYLAYYFRSDEGRKLLKGLAQGATRYNLSKRALLNLEFSLPDVYEQTAIAQILSDMDAEIAALEARRDKTRAIKQGMMQELLTGRTRLVEPETIEAA